MNENIQSAVTTTEAPVTEQAPVEESTASPIESSEKTENTNNAIQDTVTTQEQLIPKQRLDEVIAERNELRKWKEEQEAARVEQERLANMTPEEQVQQQQLEVAKETLKKMGFVTKEEQERREQEQKAANMFISECNRLESLHDGKDGLPVFKAKDIAVFMDELASRGQYISDPETAYKLKHLDEIADMKAKAQKSSTYSERQQGGMNQVTDERKEELEAATQTGDFTSFLKKFAGMPKN